jgi:DNA-binding transcriptional regulator YiaG
MTAKTSFVWYSVLRRVAFSSDASHGEEHATMPATTTMHEHIAALMTSFGISHAELARVLETSDRTVLRWLADETYPQHEARRKLDALDALADRLATSFDSREGAQAWLRAESGYFGGLRPLDALLSGRIDAVDNALEALDAGVFV